MKSLHEINFWNSISTRLSNLSEEPDDNWEKIVARIPKSAPKWMDNTGHVFTVTGLLFLLMLFAPASGRRVVSSLSQIKEEASSDLPTVVYGDMSVERNLPLADELTASGDHQEKANDKSRDFSGRVVTQNDRLSENLSDEIKIDLSKAQEASSHNESQDRNLSDLNLASDSSSKIKVASAAELRSDVVIKNDSIMKDIFDVKELNKDTVRVSTRVDRKKSTFHPKIYFGVAPSLTYFKMLPKKNDDVIISGLKRNGIFDPGRLGVQFDVGIEQPINNRFNLVAGILYFSQNQMLTYNYFDGEIQSIESGQAKSYTITPKQQTDNFRFSSSTTGVNIGMFYTLNENHLMHQLGAGFQFLQASNKIVSEEGVEKSKSAMLNYTVSYRMSLPLNKKLTVYFQPSYIRGLSFHKISREPFDIKTSRAAFGLGAIYRF